VVVAAVPPPALVSTPAPVPPPAPIVPEVKPEPPKVAPPSALTENVPPVPDPLESTGRYRIEPEPKKGFGNWFRGLFAGKSDAPRPAAAKKAADAQPVDEGPAPLRIVTREGVVARSWNPDAQRLGPARPRLRPRHQLPLEHLHQHPVEDTQRPDHRCHRRGSARRSLAADSRLENRNPQDRGGLTLPKWNLGAATPSSAVGSPFSISFPHDQPH